MMRLTGSVWQRSSHSLNTFLPASPTKVMSQVPLSPKSSTGAGVRVLSSLLRLSAFLAHSSRGATIGCRRLLLGTLRSIMPCSMSWPDV